MADSRKIAILGSSGHALAVWDACLSVGYELVAFVDPLQSATSIEGVPVVSEESGIHFGTVEIALGIGDNFKRQQVASRLLKEHPEASLSVIVHESATVSPSARLGAGTVVLAQANVGPLSTTGVGALLNSGSSLDHESELGNFASLGPGCQTGGNVIIGDRTMVGLNAGILQGVRIGADTLIGAQSLVRADIPAETVAYGVPCVPVRTRRLDEH